MDINLNPVFLTAIEMIDDEVFLGADGRHVFVCQKNRLVLAIIVCKLLVLATDYMMFWKNRFMLATQFDMPERVVYALFRLPEYLNGQAVFVSLM